MKQNITVEQLNELSEKGKEKLWEWVKKGAILPNKDFMADYMTTGMMIEFLGKVEIIINDVGIYIKHNKTVIRTKDEELADALWEAVKEVLNG